MEEKFYSMNDDIYFRLHDSGHKILDKEATEFHKEYPNIDIQVKWQPYKESWYKKQMWQLFSTFGGVSFAGSFLPIYDLTFEDPTGIK